MNATENVLGNSNPTTTPVLSTVAHGRSGRVDGLMDRNREREAVPAEWQTNIGSRMVYADEGGGVGAPETGFSDLAKHSRSRNDSPNVED